MYIYIANSTKTFLEKGRRVQQYKVAAGEGAEAADK